MVSEGDGEIVRINPTLARMLGYGWPGQMMTHVQFANSDRLFAQCGQGQELFREMQAAPNGVIRRDKLEIWKRGEGQTLWVSYSHRQLRDRLGYPLASVSFFTDISRQMTFFDAAPLGVCFSDLEGDRFHEVNATLARIFGYENPEKMRSAVSKISQDFYLLSQDRQNFLTRLVRDGKATSKYLAKKRGGHEVIWVEEDALLISGGAPQGGRPSASSAT